MNFDTLEKHATGAGLKVFRTFNSLCLSEDRLPVVWYEVRSFSVGGGQARLDFIDRERVPASLLKLLPVDN